MYEYPDEVHLQGLSRSACSIQVPCGGWELVASFAEEVAAIAEPLRLSDHKRDQRIASAVRFCPCQLRPRVSAATHNLKYKPYVKSILPLRCAHATAASGQGSTVQPTSQVAACVVELPVYWQPVTKSVLATC